MNRKEELLHKIYFDPQGFSSMNKLFHDAKAIDNTITFDFVKNWYKQNVKPKGYVGSN